VERQELLGGGVKFSADGKKQSCHSINRPAVEKRGARRKEGKSGKSIFRGKKEKSGNSGGGGGKCREILREVKKF